MEKQILEDYIKQGLSFHKIAKETGYGFSTIRYWVKKLGLEESKKQIYFKQEKCLTCEKELSGNQTKYCCKNCKYKDPVHKNSNYTAQSSRGYERRQKLIEYKGGECCKCGYNRNQSALEFHHLNPEDKTFGIDIRRCSNCKWEKLVAEADKCILICANCHRELHHPELSKL